MSTMTNPMWNAMLPGAPNPTGTSVSVPTGKSTTSGGNPLLYNPYGTSTSAPTAMNPISAGFPANSGGYSPASLLPSAPGGKYPSTNVGQAAIDPIGGMSTMSPKDLSRLFDSLKKSYGSGPANAIMDFLTSGAGFNQQAINNLFAAMQPGIERGEEDLMTQFSASGNRFGSGAQIGLADYLSQVQLNEGQLETQMYEKAIQDYLSVLMPTSNLAAELKANSPSIFDQIMGGIGTAVGAATGLGSLGGAVKGLGGLFGGGGGGFGGNAGAGAITTGPTLAQAGYDPTVVGGGGESLGGWY